MTVSAIGEQVPDKKHPYASHMSLTACHHEKWWGNTEDQEPRGQEQGGMDRKKQFRRDWDMAEAQEASEQT
jgi:hypothetical protein